MKTQYIKAMILIFIVTGLIRNATSQNIKKQAPAQTAASGTQTGINKPVNLKVLSKDLSNEDIQALMRSYTKAIGAPCGYCHEENSQTKTTDFSSVLTP